MGYGVEIIRVAINLLLLIYPLPRKIRHVTTHSSLLNSATPSSILEFVNQKLA